MSILIFQTFFIFSHVLFHTLKSILYFILPSSIHMSKRITTKIAYLWFNYLPINDSLTAVLMEYYTNHLWIVLLFGYIIALRVFHNNIPYNIPSLEQGFILIGGIRMKTKKPLLLLLLVLLFALFPVGCRYKDTPPDKAVITKETLSVKNSNMDLVRQNDLVYRDYGTGIRLSANSSLTIPELDLELKEETAIICAVNLLNNEVFKISDYQPNQTISFSSFTDGVYQLIALISTGEQRDLTLNALVKKTITTEDNANGFILLQ